MDLTGGPVAARGAVEGVCGQQQADSRSVYVHEYGVGQVKKT